MKNNYESKFLEYALKQLKWGAKAFLVGIVFLILLGVSSYFVEGALTDNIISSWSFDNNQANDTLGRYNASSITASYTSDGLIGGAFTYNGANQYIRLPTTFNSSVMDSNFSVCGAFVVNSFYTDVKIVYMSSTRDIAITVKAADKKLEFNWYSGGFYDINSSVNSLVSGSWYTFCAVRDKSSSLNLYLNGTLVATRSYTGNAGAVTRGDVFGAQYVSSYSSFFNGSIDEVNYWNRVLSSAEVLAIHNNFSVGCGYPFNCTVTVVDYSPVFVDQSPSDLTSTNVFGTRLNITYNMSDTNITGNWIYSRNTTGDTGGSNLFTVFYYFPYPTYALNNTNFKIFIDSGATDYNVTLSQIDSGCINYANQIKNVQLDFTRVNSSTVKIGCYTSGSSYTNAFHSGNMTNQSVLYQLNYPVWLNYSSSLNDVVNGTSVSSNRQKSYNSNNSINYSFLLNDNEVYPAVYNINQEHMQNTAHTTATLSANEYLLIELIGIDVTKTYNIFSLMANTTSSNPLFYCNSSYSTGNPSNNTNCVQFATLDTQNFNYTSNHSQYNLFNLPINNTGFIGNVKATSTSYFILKGNNIGVTNYYYINEQTRTGQTQTSNNAGSSYTNQNFIVDSHLKQFNTTDAITYNACYTNSSGTQICNTLRSDVYNSSKLNPTTPNIITTTNTDYPYNQTITLNYTASRGFNSSTTITSYNISLLNSDQTFNKTINASTTLLTQSFNPSSSSIGTYYIKIQAKDSNNLTSYAISQPFNITSIINIRLKNAYTNNIVNNFSGWIYNVPTGINTTYSTTGNVSTINLYTGQNNIYIEQPTYSIGDSNYYNLTINNTATTYNYNFSLYTSNSIYIIIKDESTYNTINQSIVLDVQYLNSTINTTSTSNGIIFLQDLLDGEYTLVFRGDFGVNYTTRTYVVTVASRSTQNLVAYLSNSGTTVLLSLKDSYTNNLIEGATISLYKNINNTYTLIEVKNSDITGKAQFVYVPLTPYRFVVQKTGYRNKIFDLNPIIFSSYDVPLDRLISYIYTGSQEDVKILYTPQQYFANETTSFSFVISSADGVLNSYGVNISYPCGNKTFSGNNSIGETYNTSFSITCAHFRDTINITYWYVAVGQPQRTYNEMYYISGTYSGSNFTWSKIGKNSETYGLGDLERIFIVTLLVLIVAGTTYLMIGGIGSLAMALLIFGYFSYTGFIPFWSIAISVIAGIFLLIGGKD